MENNIKKAIRQEELSHPPMPKDLNARLMQRVEKEVNSRPKRKRIVWPWIAAACVTAILVVNLTPPKATQGSEAESQVAHVAKDSAKQDREAIRSEESQTLIANVGSSQTERQEKKSPVAAKNEENLMAKAESNREAKAESMATTEMPDTKEKNLDIAEKPHTESEARVLTEHDFAITRPENLKYTKEELALMKRQAKEAYAKWVELELEIAKYNQEQTAAR